MGLHEMAAADGPTLFVAEEAASLALPLPASNRGFKLLQRLGWQAGCGLGSRMQGRVEPVPLTDKRDALGLGRSTLEVGRRGWHYAARLSEFWRCRARLPPGRPSRGGCWRWRSR